MVKAILMFYNKEIIQNVLDDIQIMADESIIIIHELNFLDFLYNFTTEIQKGRLKFVKKLDDEAKFVCKCFLGMLAIAICVWSGGPVAAIIYRTITNTYTPHMYGHPFKAV